MGNPVRQAQQDPPGTPLGEAFSAEDLATTGVVGSTPVGEVLSHEMLIQARDAAFDKAARLGAELDPASEARFADLDRHVGAEAAQARCLELLRGLCSAYSSMRRIQNSAQQTPRDQYHNPLEQIQKLWLELDNLERRTHLEWLWTRCETCGREGRWGRKPWQSFRDEPPPIYGTHCDACCADAGYGDDDEK